MRGVFDFLLPADYCVLDSLLSKLITALDRETALLAVPEICVDKIIMLYHKGLFVGHQGVIIIFHY